MRKRLLLILCGLIITAAVAAGFSRTSLAEDYRPKAAEGQARPPVMPTETPPSVRQNTPFITVDMADGAEVRTGQRITGKTSIASDRLQVRLKSLKGGQLISQELSVPGSGERAFTFTLNFDPTLASGSPAVLEISEVPATPAARLIREVRIP